MNVTARCTARRNAGQRGFTMVESLVALIVLSVGLLGVAGLYVSTLKAERTAQFRTQAVTLVNDMVDRVRANASARGSYNLADYSTAPASHDCVGEAMPCTRENLAAEDLATWIASTKSTLPAGSGTVSVALAAGVGQPDTYTVSVEWQEPGEPTKFQYQNILTMIPVTP
jgi:type IV pilus assembly protein PilV